MQFLYLLEKIRMPILNEFMLLITHFGEETAFLVAALIVFWCVDKYKGYYMMLVGFAGTIINQFLKLACRVPRPWVKDPNFTILEQAREEATGFSFPSGHSQNAVGIFGAIAHTAVTPWIKAVAIAIAVLVPLSRLYVGVHTPADVLAGSAIALALVFGLKKPILSRDHKTMKIIIAGMVVMSLSLVAYVELWRFPADMDSVNLASGFKNAYTMLGCLTGAAVVYLVDHRFTNFDTKAVWWAQILKAVLGLLVVLVVKEGMKLPLDALGVDAYLARAIRYFLVVLTAGCVWPLTFPWFAKLGGKK